MPVVDPARGGRNLDIAAVSRGMTDRDVIRAPAVILLDSEDLLRNCAGTPPNDDPKRGSNACRNAIRATRIARTVRSPGDE